MSIGNPPPGDREPTDDRPSVGRVLAEARLAAGLTVEQLSTSTRVRIPIIHAIERDDFSRCGGDFYARGHIRLLARMLGVDPEPLVARFDAEHAGQQPLMPPPQLFEAERIQPDRRRPNWTAAMVAAIAVVIVFVGFNLFSGGGGAGNGAAGDKSSTSSPSTSQRSPSPTKPAPSSSDIAAVPADKVTVKLTAVGGRSWVSVTNSNGESKFQNVLEEGKSKTFDDDKKLNLTIGNAGVVQMFVNGKDLGKAGEEGRVVRLQFTPGDPEAG